MAGWAYLARCFQPAWPAQPLPNPRPGSPGRGSWRAGTWAVLFAGLYLMCNTMTGTWWALDRYGQVEEYMARYGHLGIC